MDRHHLDVSFAVRLTVLIAWLVFCKRNGMNVVCGYMSTLEAKRHQPTYDAREQSWCVSHRMTTVTKHNGYMSTLEAKRHQPTYDARE